MSMRRSAVPFLGALGVSLTTLAVGYYAYKYLSAQWTQSCPDQSSHTMQPPTEKISDSVMPTQPPAQDDVPPLRLSTQDSLLSSPALYELHENNPSCLQDDVPTLQPSTQDPVRTSPALHEAHQNNPLCLQDDLLPSTPSLIVTPPQVQDHPTSRGESEQLPFDAGPSVHEFLSAYFQATDAYDDEDEPRSQSPRFTSEPLVKRACHITLNKSFRTINMVIQQPVPRTQLKTDFRECLANLKKSTRAHKVLAIVGAEHASSHLSLIRLRKALDRLGLADTSRRCKHLEVKLPKMDHTSGNPHLLPLTLPELETLRWKGFRKQLHLIGPDTLNHLTHLTLISSISFRDCVYLLRCVCNTLRECSIGKLDDGNDMFPDPHHISSDIVDMRQLESFSILSMSSPTEFLNGLGFCGDQLLTTLAIEVHSGDPVDPREMKSVPWVAIENLKIKCNFVNGGAEWVRKQAVQCDLSLYEDRAGQHGQCILAASAKTD